MEGGYLAQQLLNGLVLGSLYALVATGFSMIYSILRLVNFAHGDVLTIGALVAVAATTKMGWPFGWVLLVVMGAGVVVGIGLELAAFRPIRSAPQVTGFITSLAVSIFLQNLGIMTLTAQPRVLRLPGALASVTTVMGLRMRGIDVMIVALSVALLVLLELWVQRTKTGMAMRAVAENVPVAQAMGIEVNRVILLTFAVGSALATLAGVMWAGRSGQVDPLMGFVPGLKSFVAAVLGGVGSLPGAIVGAYVLGLVEVLFVGLLPPIYSGYRDSFVFGLLLLILLVRPAGLLGRKEEVL